MWRGRIGRRCRVAPRPQQECENRNAERGQQQWRFGCVPDKFQICLLQLRDLALCVGFRNPPQLDFALQPSDTVKVLEVGAAVARHSVPKEQSQPRESYPQRGCNQEMAHNAPVRRNHMGGKNSGGEQGLDQPI